GISGGDGTDTIVGPDAAVTWTINGAGAGVVGSTSFSGIEKLQGGSDADRFRMANAGSISSIDGGAGTDTLDYSKFNAVVTVNLSTSTATGVSGFSSIESA